MELWDRLLTLLQIMRGYGLIKYELNKRLRPYGDTLRVGSALLREPRRSGTAAGEREAEGGDGEVCGEEERDEAGAGVWGRSDRS